MSSTIRANRNEKQELFMLANNVPFDDRINLKAHIEDLKPSLISNFLYEVGSELYHTSLQMPFRELVAGMRLSGGPVEMIKPLNAGQLYYQRKNLEVSKACRS